MIGLIQRVSSASVSVDDKVIGAIGRGILVLAAVEPADSAVQVARLAQRLLGYRIFPDDAGKMNRSTLDIGGGVLLVPQFTLAADTTRGMRPSFTSAAPPELGRQLFDALVLAVRERCEPTGNGPASGTGAGRAAGICAGAGESRVQTGSFGADMKVALVNDGPVTFLLRVKSGE